MSNSVAEAYLLIVRESNVPVFGEAVPLPFTGQIELDSWSWEVKNRIWEAKERTKAEDEANKTKGTTDARGAKGSKSATRTTGSDAKDNAALFKPDGLIRQVTEMQGRDNLSQTERDKRVRELIKKAVAGYADAASSGSSDNDDEKKSEYEEHAMTLKFEKGVDLATTPLLTALANGEILPQAILTLFHRAKGAPVTLAITMGDIRLKSCDISCDPDDKMADLKEKWEATYQTVNWVYQSRPAAAGPSLGLSLITQGQVRVFAMQEEMPPI